MMNDLSKTVFGKSRKIALLGGFASILLCSGGPALAQPDFNNGKTLNFGKPSPAVAKLIEQNYQPVLTAEGGENSTTAALADLRGDGQAEIAVRFGYSNMCDEQNGCFTTILQYDAGADRWNQVFAQRTKSLAVSTSQSSGIDAPLLVNGQYIWSFLRTGYVPNLKDYATSLMTPDQQASGELLASLDKIFDTTDVRYRVTIFDGADAGKLVAATGDQAEIGMTEAPLNILSETYGLVLSTYSHGLFGIGPLSHGGAPDILVATDAGIEYWGWDSTKHRYEMYATSYVSKVSPAP